MPKFPAYSHLPLYNAPMQVAITYPSIRETSGLTTELPTSEPGTAQISYTVEAGDLPVCAPLMPFAYAPFIYAQGQNTGGAARIVSYRIEKNGTSLRTGNMDSAANNYYFALSAASFCAAAAGPPVVGDVLTVKLWANGAGVRLNAHALVPYLSRPLYGLTRLVVWRGYAGTNAIARESSARKPSWMSATPYVGPAGNNAIQVGPIGTATFAVVNITENVPNAWCTAPSYGLFRTQFSDVSQFYQAVASAAASLNFLGDLGATLLTYLPLNIKI